MASSKHGAALENVLSVTRWLEVWVFRTLILWLYKELRAALLSIKLAGKPSL